MCSPSLIAVLENETCVYHLKDLTLFRRVATYRNEKGTSTDILSHAGIASIQLKNGMPIVCVLGESRGCIRLIVVLGVGHHGVGRAERLLHSRARECHFGAVFVLQRRIRGLRLRARVHYPRIRHHDWEVPQCDSTRTHACRHRQH